MVYDVIVIVWLFILVAGFVGYWICIDILDICVYRNNIYYVNRFLGNMKNNSFIIKFSVSPKPSLHGHDYCDSHTNITVVFSLLKKFCNGYCLSYIVVNYDCY